jgi:hypothetical protein
MRAVRRLLGIQRGGTHALVAVAQLAGGDYDVQGAERVGEELAMAAVKQLLAGCEVRGCTCVRMCRRCSLPGCCAGRVVGWRATRTPGSTTLHAEEGGAVASGITLCYRSPGPWLPAVQRSTRAALFYRPQDDSGVLEALAAAVAAGPDPELEALTGCTGCRTCNHEGGRKGRVKSHARGCEHCGTSAGCTPRPGAACGCRFHATTADRQLLRVVRAATKTPNFLEKCRCGRA